MSRPLAPLWALVPGRTGVPLMKVGGAPEAPGPLEWPACAMCGGPQRFLFQLPHVEGRLDLAPHASVHVFQCENPDTTCFRWDPEEGANAAVPVMAGAPSVSAPPGPVKPYAEWTLGFAPATEDTEALSVDVNEATEEQLLALDRAQEEAPESKVGGVPGWLNGEATPECCDAPMRFVAQLAAMPFGLDFGDNGRGYLFRCTREDCVRPFRFLTQGA
ncbi:hypothetical protein [Corallococcus sp. AS-1-6]|uniref:hypothetical protein n=1 Tax=Corallococcus sp. AS-1-6 TaxID=2874599 RepID=UPI001CBB4499|nr:hypothetical protein [Corallococcus sp. AS-1-6]MBZ4376923.1 hypothetical protein [Corallococcus sp. AS-1-6]